MSLTVPVVVLNWNGVEDTLECLESLMRQNYPNFTVHLVDNGSDERDVSVLREKFAGNPRVSLILNRENLGFARGNNAVLRQILAAENPSKHVALLNNDTAADPAWLERLVACAEKTGAGTVSSKMVNYYDRSRMDNAGHRMLNTAEIIPVGHGEPVENYCRSFENMGSCAGAALYSVEMLRQIGVFDEYFETGYEDAELGVRAVVLGWRSVFEPEAVVFHKISRSVGKVLNFNYLLKVQLNIFYSYFKLMPSPTLLLNLPFVLFKYGAVLVMDVVFLRLRFLKIMSCAIWLALFRERKTILRSRRAFFEKHRPVSTWEILKRQEFFLWFDLKRFVRHIVLRKPTAFERY